MNDSKMFSEMLGGILSQLPMLFVCLVGILVALIFWRRAPIASLWTFLAFGLALLLCVLIPVSQQTMWRMMNQSSLDTKVTANIALAFIWSVFRAISYVLLLLGVYAGRKSVSVASGT
jgi:predicted membrane channel-forming protein YqfA (hemolysin III family)